PRHGNERAARPGLPARSPLLQDRPLGSTPRKSAAMPIRPPEPALYPDDLFAPQPPAAAAGARWLVLHLKPRQEKCLLRDLRERRVACYLPLVERRLRIRGRAVSSFVPLFEGYVFMLGERQDRLSAFSTRRVVRALEVVDQEQLWYDLRQVHRLI